jgi:hypothetical protein
MAQTYSTPARALAVGDRLLAAQDIDRYPDAIIPQGDILRVTEVTDKGAWAFDETRTIHGLAAWDNCVQFDKDRPWYEETHLIKSA